MLMSTHLFLPWYAAWAKSSCLLARGLSSKIEDVHYNMYTLESITIARIERYVHSSPIITATVSPINYYIFTRNAAKISFLLFYISFADFHSLYPTFQPSQIPNAAKKHASISNYLISINQHLSVWMYETKASPFSLYQQHWIFLTQLLFPKILDSRSKRH